jgi:acyl-CoA dehydrogenase
MTYRAPIDDYTFLLKHVLAYDTITATDKFSDADQEVAEAILTEAAKMAEEALAPLQRVGDVEHSRLENGIVRTPTGFGEGYRAIAEGGWIGMAATPEYGGMGLPLTLQTCVNEMMNGACLSLALNPLMTQGQIEALEHHGSDALKAIYLPKLISGAWSGTMNLTEPQAGSDVGALRSKAIDNGDGTYGVTGEKIFISWGDNDFTENVCHLVLARLPDGREGTKGISLFLVPKYIPDGDGDLGKANSLQVVSLEQKVGLHASPTAIMSYDNATGWLVGEPHAGMKAMFTMMNNARLGVGAEGLGVAEAATQAATSFASERRQGKTLVNGGSGAIIDHADVRRMLMTMRAQTYAARGICLATAVALDLAKANGDPTAAARAALLTPMAKAFGTDTGTEVANLGIQVHGGMGFIEETGAAQFWRDVRVTAIYEGTNGIQAMDLVGRKLMDGGDAAFALLDEIALFANEAKGDLAERLDAAVADLRSATKWMLNQTDMNARFAGATSYLRAFSLLFGGYVHLKSAKAEGDGPTRAALAGFYFRHLMPAISTLCAVACEGDGDLYALSAENLASA